MTTLLAWLACAVLLWFVIRALLKQFAQIDWSTISFAFAPTAASVACLFAVSAMQLIARWTLLSAYGYPLGWRVQLPAAWVPQLGKYVPGGIASVGGAVYLLRRAGVGGAVALSVAVLLDALAVMAGLIVSTPLLLWDPVRARLPMAWLACVVMTVVGVVLLHPRVFVALLNLALRKVGRRPIDAVPPLGHYLWPVLASFGQWVFAGLALWFMTAALTDVPTRLIPLCIATAALAMTISYLAPFAPGGIGVREGIFLFVLSPMLPPSERPKVAIVVVAMRIAQTLIELLLAGVGMALLRNQRNALDRTALG
jgi:uncharacterized membrane protein YbhN (UPF0104 family)